VASSSVWRWRLGEVLAFIKRQQDQQPPPSRVMTNSEKIGYRKTGRKSPGRPGSIDKALARRQPDPPSAAAAAEGS
jgi:hypothetical protein